MKNYLQKGILLLAPLMLFSCFDLTEKPVGLLAPEAVFRSTKDVESVIFGAYGWMASERIYGRQFATALMLRDDMSDIGDRGTPAERQQVNDFNMDDSNNMIHQFWPYWYQVIGAANAAISGAKSLALPDAEINPLIAEARFVRAFAYFHLVRVFGAIPYIDTFVTNTDDVSRMTRTPTATVYNAIRADFEFAKLWLPDRQPANVRSRPTKGTAGAFLADVFLTLRDYAGAYREAKWVITNKARFGYALEPDFQNLFRAPQANDMPEHLFALDFLGLHIGLNGTNDDIMPPMTGIRGGDAPRSGWSVIVPSQKVFDTWDGRDYRKQVSFDTTIAIGGQVVPYTDFPNTKRPHIAKYARFTGNSNAEGRDSDHNYAAMRYAEVLLIAAEAAGELQGASEEAIGYVNEVRARARNQAGTLSAFPKDLAPELDKKEFIDLVLEERRIELAFEYKRWYDIQRRRLGDAVFKGPDSTEPHDNFNASRDYLMPIPRSELLINPNLTQNPGY